MLVMASLKSKLTKKILFLDSGTRMKESQYRGPIFSRVRPFYEQAVSDLDT
jgi:hypothetical protein